MKKKIIFCLLSLSLMIAGCQSNEIEDITPPSKEVQLSPEELLSIRYKSSPELSQTEVFNLLTTFQSSELKNNAHSRITFQPNIFQIKEKYYLSKNAQMPDCNWLSDGILVLCADSKISYFS